MEPSVQVFQGPLTDSKANFRRLCNLKREGIGRSDSYPPDLATVRHKVIIADTFSQHTGLTREEIESKGKDYFKQLNSKIVELMKNPEWGKNESSLRKFYYIANQLLIFHQKIEICLLCISKKKKGKPRSHIFPEALLYSYGAIHYYQYSDDKDKRFILDMSKMHPDKRIARMSPKTVRFPLCCESCESRASSDEKFLLETYEYIMASGTVQDITIEEKEYHRLKHVLAILLFRGALLAINFHEDIFLPGYKDIFFKAFFELRNFCCEDDSDKYATLPTARNFHLFLLPNGHFNPNNIEPTYVLDCQLRNPQFTSVAYSGETPFLYMKFDCFHCVLPFYGDIEGLTDENSFSGKWETTLLATTSKGDSTVSSKEKKIIVISPQTAINKFPEPLLHYNLFQPETLLSCIMDLQFPKNIVAAIQMSRMVKPKFKFMLKGHHTNDTQILIPQSNKKPSLKLRDAQNFSPVRGIKDAKNLLRALEEKNLALRRERESLEKKYLADIEKKDSEIEELEKEVRALKTSLQEKSAHPHGQDTFQPFSVEAVPESAGKVASPKQPSEPALLQGLGATSLHNEKHEEEA